MSVCQVLYLVSRSSGQNSLFLAMKLTTFGQSSPSSSSYFWTCLSLLKVVYGLKATGEPWCSRLNRTLVEYERIIRKGSKTLFKRTKSVIIWLVHSGAVKTNKQSCQCVSAALSGVCSRWRWLCVVKNLLVNINSPFVKSFCSLGVNIIVCRRVLIPLSHLKATAVNVQLFVSRTSVGTAKPLQLRGK